MIIRSDQTGAPCGTPRYDGRSPFVDRKRKGQVNRSSTLSSVTRQVGDDPERKGERHREDFYRTGEVATRALFAVEDLRGTVWECACGTGDMSRVLEAAPGVRVLSTDLVDRGYGTSGPAWDFLHAPLPPGVDHIVTNPPFRFVDEFVLRALELDPPGKIAFIARLQWLEGKRRKRTIFDGIEPRSTT